MTNFNFRFILLILIAIIPLCSFAQWTTLSSLNSFLQGGGVKLEINSKIVELHSIRLKEFNEYSLILEFRTKDPSPYVKYFDCTITGSGPFLVEDGKWIAVNGNYKQQGDVRKIHIYTAPDYGTNNFEYKEFRKDGVLGHAENLHGFTIIFANVGAAKEFVMSCHKLQGNRYNITPWLRTINETNEYKSKSSKDLFHSLNSDFKQYNISSRQVHFNEDWTKTSKINIYFDYPNIIIKYSDIQTTELRYGNEFKSGIYTLTIPLDESSFEFGAGYFGGNNEEVIRIFSKSGIEISYKGKKNIVEYVDFYASKKVSEKILTKLRVFRNLLIAEDFKGSYGTTTTKHKSTTKTLRPSQKLSNGKYTQ